MVGDVGVGLFFGWFWWMCYVGGGIGGDYWVVFFCLD